MIALNLNFECGSEGGTFLLITYMTLALALPVEWLWTSAGSSPDLSIRGVETLEHGKDHKVTNVKLPVRAGT